MKEAESEIEIRELSPVIKNTMDSNYIFSALDKMENDIIQILINSNVGLKAYDIYFKLITPSIKEKINWDNINDINKMIDEARKHGQIPSTNTIKRSLDVLFEQGFIGRRKQHEKKDKRVTYVYFLNPEIAQHIKIDKDIEKKYKL
jgi:predicted transcriptional regulator